MLVRYIKVNGKFKSVILTVTSFFVLTYKKNTIAILLPLILMAVTNLETRVMASKLTRSLQR